MVKNEKGYIVVETIGSFLLFTLMIVAILSMISIVTIQARIHYAITEACETVSMYSYVLDLTGSSGHIQKNSAKAGAVQGHIDEFKTNVNGLLDGIKNIDVNQVGEKGEALTTQIESGVDYAITDPKEMLQYLMNYGLNEAGGKLFEIMVRPLIGHYLRNGSLSGDQYLRNYGVVDGLSGLDFYRFDLFDLGSVGARDSELLNGDGDVRIVVSYDLEYSFGALILPFDEPKLHMTQEVKTKAWLGGEGEGYRR